MRMTTATALVLDAFLAGASYGFEISDRTGLQAGTVYPILRRLEEARLVRSRWEAADRAHAEGRPPRRLYQLTALGTKRAAEARLRYPSLVRAAQLGEEPAG